MLIQNLLSGSKRRTFLVLVCFRDNFSLSIITCNAGTVRIMAQICPLRIFVSHGIEL